MVTALGSWVRVRAAPYPRKVYPFPCRRSVLLPGSWVFLHHSVTDCLRISEIILSWVLNIINLTQTYLFMKSIVTCPSFSFSLLVPELVRSEIRVFISSLPGSKPSARSATFRSFMSIVPVPSVSKRLKASLISAICGSVSSCRYCPLTLPFFLVAPGYLAGFIFQFK